MSVYRDIYGDIKDVATVEDAIVQTLQLWIVSHLAVQEDRHGLAARALPSPRSWPAVSEFNLKVEEQLPAIVIESPSSSTNPKRDQNGDYRQTWPFIVHAVCSGQTERDARKLASAYLAAVIGALTQNGTLGGVAMHTRWTGPDRYIAGTVGQGSSTQRAIYSTTFDVTVRAVVNDLKGPASPLPDPYNPTPPADPFDTAQVTVTSVRLENTP